MDISLPNRDEMLGQASGIMFLKPPTKSIRLAIKTNPDDIEGDTAMRTIIVAGMTAAAIGLAASTGASAAPANGAVIGDLATATGHVTTVQHWRWGSGGHWRWGSGGHWRWRSRGY
jgi:hypothetical protein